MPTSPSYRRIYATIRCIPRGRVATYGQIAELAGLGPHARQVGYALHALPTGHDIPWHRVINAQGRVSLRTVSTGAALQRALLESEGVIFRPGGAVDLACYQWRPRSRKRVGSPKENRMARARAYWLVKSEPDKYAWQDLVRDRRTYWDGVRNHAARNHLAAMKRGDWLLYYHSNQGKEIVGIAEVVREAYPDPTSDDPRWVVVDVAPRKPLKTAVTLAQVKADPQLSSMALVRQARLSVQPVEREEFDRILKLGGTSRPR